MKINKLVLFALIITSISISMVGCGKKRNSEDAKIDVKILESSKQRPPSTKKDKTSKNNEDLLIVNDDSENEEISQYKDVDINVGDVTTYTYFSLKEFPKASSKENNLVMEIDTYQDWLEIKATYPEVFSLINQDLLTIQENYFSHSKGFLVIKKEFEENKFVKTRKITKQGKNLNISFVQDELLSSMENYSDIIEVVPNFEERILETAVIYFFNREEIEDINKNNIIMNSYVDETEVEIKVANKEIKIDDETDNEDLPIELSEDKIIVDKVELKEETE